MNLWWSSRISPLRTCSHHNASDARLCAISDWDEFGEGWRKAPVFPSRWAFLVGGGRDLERSHQPRIAQHVETQGQTGCGIGGLIGDVKVGDVDGNNPKDVVMDGARRWPRPTPSGRTCVVGPASGPIGEWGAFGELGDLWRNIGDDPVPPAAASGGVGVEAGDRVAGHRTNGRSPLQVGADVLPAGSGRDVAVIDHASIRNAEAAELHVQLLCLTVNEANHLLTRLSVGEAVPGEKMLMIGQDCSVNATAIDLGPKRMIVSLPTAEAVQLLPGCELLCQEGFTTWSVAVEQIDMATELVRQFPRRARFGVRGISTPDEAVAARRAGAHFVASSFADPSLVDAVPGLPVVINGGTVTELRAALAAGASAVELWPGESYGLTSAPELVRQLGRARLIVGGELSSDMAREWFSAGAFGIWPNDVVDAESLLADRLDPVREQLHWWQNA